MKIYKTISGEAKSEFTEKHSRFLGYVRHTETDEEAVAFIDEIRSLNSDARHNIYAYVLNEDNRSRFSDDGEPHGTAGKPALDIINGYELRDVTVVVTRYFGGILLGTGGLVRAYSKAVKDAIEAAEQVLMVPGDIIEARCDYALYDKFESILKEFDADIFDTDFSDRVMVTFSVRKSVSESFLEAVRERLSSRVLCEIKGEKYAKEKILK